MYWIREMQNAIGFIEDRLLDDISMEEIAENANSSNANFQRIFRIATGMTAGDYIRSRRLSLAGEDLVKSSAKVLDIALKYGYATAESFTKAFARFHGVTPSAAKRRASVLKTFSPFTITVDIRGGFTMQRKLIPNVPEIPYDGNNAAFFITLLEATLKGLGEEYDKAMLIALSGEGNRFCWTQDAWVFGNELTESINETPFETEHRVLSAIGWDARYITVQRDRDGGFMNTDAAQIRRDLVSAIDKGFPVLIRYVEHDDCDINVFFGYEDDGRKIIGYDYNNDFEPGVSAASEVSVPVAWDDWENNLAGYILLEGNKHAPSERETAFAAFRFICEHARKTDTIRGKLVGLAAWEAFLHQVEYDDFSQLSADEVKSRFFIYCDALCQIYARQGPLPYYRSLAARFSEWRDPLEAAVTALKECASYGGFLWKCGFTFDEAGFEKFRSASARKILTDAGYEAMRKDILAVTQFEAILS